MKKLLIAFLLVSNFLSAQLPTIVSAPITEKLLLEQSVESKANFAKQIKEIQQQGKLLKAAKNQLVKVNSYVKTGKKAKNIIATSKEIYDLLYASINNVKGNKYPAKLKTRTLNSYEEILKDLEETSGEVSKILSDDVYKMDDSARLTYLNDLSKDMEKIKIKIYKVARNSQRYVKLYRSYKSKN